MKLGERIWHCKMIDDKNASIPKFELPYSITLRLRYLTVQPSGSAYSELVEYGGDVSQYQTLMAQPYSLWDGVWQEGDRVYADGRIPNADDLIDNYAENANYIVDSVKKQNEAIRIVIKRRTAE